ncbi:hypothetical protein [Eggerthella sinensis]|uniref:hypothetical protein n=1 Tax=Eggerthella sinensis TaxID=242230 RepID=UPI00266D252C|nr:hypothetical protein [Eggerthella sinensis]
MKSPATIALACATPLVIAASFALPDLVSALQDEARSTAVAHYDSKLVQLDIEPSNDVAHALETLASDTTLYSMDESEHENAHDARAALGDTLPLARDDAEAASTPLARALALCDLASCSLEEHPLVAVSADGGQAIMLWDCRLEDRASDVFASAFVDDESGKIVQALVIINGAAAVREAGDAAFDDLDAALLAWAAHLGVDVDAAERIQAHAEDAGDTAVADAVAVESNVSSTAAAPDSQLGAKARVCGTDTALEATLQVTESDQVVLALEVVADA